MKNVFTPGTAGMRITWIVLSLLLGLMCAIWLVCWDVGYNSDVAMIGLMVRHFVRYGDLQLFVWDVGYQGMLLDNLLGAGLFGLLGSSPVVLAMVACVFFVLAVLVWIRRLIALFGSGAAALSLLLLLTLTPLLYTHCLRTLPNYPEAILLGLLLFTLGPAMALRPRLRTIVLFGVIGGFGVYTFALTGVFMLAALAPVMLLWLRDMSFRLAGGSPWRLLLPPFWQAAPGWRAVMTVFHLVLVLLAGAGLLLFIDGTVLPPLIPGKKPPAGIHLLAGAGFFLMSGLWVADTLQQNRRRIFTRLARMGGFLGGFLIGFSPSLIYWYVLGQKSLKGASITGDAATLWHRAGLMLQYHERMLHNGAIALCFLLALVWFASTTLVQLSLHWHRPRPEEETRRFLGRLVFLTFAVLCPAAFLVSGSVVDVESGRYLLPLLFVYCPALAALLVSMLADRRPRRWLPVLVVLLVLANGGMAMRSALAEKGAQRRVLDSVVEAFSGEGLSHGYGDYWLAYAVAFYTNEKLIIEPTYSNYGKRYGPLVREQKRVGYLQFRNLPPDLEGLRRVSGHDWRVSAVRYLDSGVDFYVLDRL